MVGCDLARMALVAGMAVPAGPFWALCTLLVAAELLSAPFGAARAALLPEVLPDDRYLVASAVSNVAIQGGQGLGFAAGGGLAAVLGTSATLALDAVTFGASAGLIWLGLRPRPAPPGPVTGIRSGSPLRSAAAGARLVGSDARLRALVGCAWLDYFFVVPDWPAPYAAALGGGAGTVGLLMAAQPAGAVVGAVPLARLVAPARRPGLMGPLAVLSCAPLLGGALHPGVVVSLALWAVSGLGTSYQLVANSAFVLAVPAACRGRGQAFGLVQSGIYAAQGAATLVAGAAAQCVAPAAVVVVAAAGALGAATATALTLSSQATVVGAAAR